MINYITQRLRKWELDGLLGAISRRYPELDEQQGETRIGHYLSQAVYAFTQAQQAYDSDPNNKSRQEPTMPALLVRTLRYWTTHAASTYSFLLIQQEIEITHLREQIARQQPVEELRQEREGVIRQLADKVTKTIQDVSESVKPDRRMN